jgi:outer membrane protein
MLGVLPVFLLLCPQDPATVPASQPRQELKLTPLDQIQIPGDEQAEGIERLRLIDCVRLGILQNTTLTEFSLVPRIRAEDVRAARAFFEPELFGTAGAGRSETPGRPNIQFGTLSTTTTTYDATVGLRQRVITGGLFELGFTPVRVRQDLGSSFSKFYTAEWAASFTQPLLGGAGIDYNTADIERARTEEASIQNDYEALRQDTLLAIVQAYWNLVFTRADYRVRRQSLDLAREQLRITDERIRAKVLAERDRIADEADVARREEDLIVAENNIRQAEDTLRRLVLKFGGGNDDWRVHLIPTSPFEGGVLPEVPTWETASELGMLRRPDLVRLRNEEKLGEIELMQARRDLLPRLDLSGSYSLDGIHSENVGGAQDQVSSLDFPDWAARLALVVPIGNSAARARELRAKLLLEKAERARRNKELDITREVRSAVWQIETLAKRIVAGKETVRLAESNLDTELSRLRVGRSTAFEVQRRNQDLAEARSTLIRSRLDLRIAWVALLKAQGTLSLAALGD